MAAPRQRFTGIGIAALATALAAGPGCMCFNRQPIPITSECAAACGDVPCACRGKVYVFLLGGLDPFDTDRIGDFRHALIQSGFTKVYSGNGLNDTFFAAEMHRLALAEPDARFVVVGFSSGAEFATSLAESVGQYQIPITLLASVDPYWWSSAPQSRPPNVEQVMHVHGEPLLFAGRATAGMDVQIPETYPNNITAHPLTLEHLSRSLASIAGTVPRPEVPPAPPVVDPTPTPRPTARHGNPARDSWDFLRPVASLKDLTPPGADAPLGTVGERTTLRPAQP